MLIVVALGIWFAVYMIGRATKSAPTTEAEASGLDRMDGIDAQLTLCPPSHGAKCTCTWR